MSHGHVVCRIRGEVAAVSLCVSIISQPASLDEALDDGGVSGLVDMIAHVADDAIAVANNITANTSQSVSFTVNVTHSVQSVVSALKKISSNMSELYVLPHGVGSRGVFDLCASGCACGDC